MLYDQGKDGASALYAKPFLFMNKLCEIYAKDRASRSKAKGPGDDEVGDKNEVENEDVAISSSTQRGDHSSG